MFLQPAPHMARADWCSHPQKPCWGSQGRGGGSREGSGALRSSQGMWAVHSPEPALPSALPSPAGSCGAQGPGAHPRGLKDPEPSCCLLLPHSCPSCACLIPGRSPQHPSARAELSSPSKSFSAAHSASLLLSKEPATWCPTYTCSFFPPRGHSMNFLSSLYFPLLTSSFSAELLPLPHTLHWLFHPGFVPCACL